MKKPKLYLLISVLLISLLSSACSKPSPTDDKTNNIEISINNELSTKSQYKYDNSIVKKEGNKYYLANNSVVDISNFSLLNENADTDVTSDSRLFTTKYGDKNMYYIYSSAIRKNFAVNNMQGLEVTGVISGYSTNSLQILDDNIYNVSLNCTVSYSNNNEYKLYSQAINSLPKDILVKILIVNNEVVKIFVL